MTTEQRTALRQPSPPHKLLTLEEAAEQLRISVDTLRRHANFGDIPTVRIGRRRLIAPEDLDRFIAHQREEHDRNVW